MSDNKAIAVVDDEEDLRGAVAAYLGLHGFEAIECASGAALYSVLSERAVDLVVLDVNMQGEDGFTIARRLRANGDIGIVMLTARAELVDRVVGLEIGADDYLTKPFELRELVARIRSVLRRADRRCGGGGDAVPETVDGIWVRGRGGSLRVSVDDIDWIEAARDYVLLHAGSRIHSVRMTMDELERQLDPKRMLRVHRSAFVRPSLIARLHPTARGGKLQLRDGQMIAVGARHLAKVADLIRITDGA
ncbi:LytR/AlgR family response regulator transcription factor [Sphingomonas sp. OTU376]|uniref:LytR/AlgR family response regulator transcription factor n=1 Tax=Sphingomonas sp. OTU376 TaxID=3043863 RepID=UPI00313B1587